MAAAILLPVLLIELYESSQVGARADAQGKECLKRSRTKENLACAVAAFSEAVKHEPDNPKYRYNLGVALGRSRMFAQAADEFREALRLNPAFPNARRNLEIYLRAVENDRAGRVADELAARFDH